MLWYISFVEDETFAGATVVEAVSAEHAIMVATARGLNPGGEALVIEVPEEAEDEPDVQAMRNVLFNKEQMTTQGGRRLADLPDEMQDVIEQEATMICGKCNDG